jgi:hypothetical protein
MKEQDWGLDPSKYCNMPGTGEHDDDKDDDKDPPK